MVAKVVSVSSGLCVVEIDGVRLQCRLRSNLTVAETSFTNVVAVGDQVIVSDNGSGGGIIEQVLPRSSILARPDVFYGHRRQLIAANVDQLLIVSSWREPHFWSELVDRYVIAAQLSGLMPVVCINKIDLVEKARELQEALRPYEMLGHAVVKTSAVTGEGIDVLREILQGQHDRAGRHVRDRQVVPDIGRSAWAGPACRRGRRLWRGSAHDDASHNAGPRTHIHHLDKREDLVGASGKAGYDGR